MSVSFTCEFPGCGTTKTAESGTVALGLMQLHQANAHSNTNAQKQRPPKMDRPKISRGSSAEEWATFLRRWEMFKSGTVSMTDTETKCQLISCCEPELECGLFQNNPKINESPEEDILKAMKELAVIDVAATVRVTELLGMKQEHGEGVRAYVARIRGKANICTLEKKCSCLQNVSYADDIVRWVMLAGLASNDIAREVLGTAEIDTKSLTDTIGIIETKERAVRALVGEPGAAAAASSYKKEMKKGLELKLDATIKCESCKKPTSQFGQNRFGRLVEHRMCLDCFRASRPKRDFRQAPKKDKAAAVHESNEDVFEALGVIHSSNASVHTQSPHAIGNYIFDGTLGWRAGDSKSQPTLTLLAAVDDSAYDHISHPTPKVKPKEVKCVSDTGAQSCLMGLKVLWQLGLNKSDLVPVQRQMHAANDEEIQLIGAIFLELRGIDDVGTPHAAHVMAYVSPSTDNFYLSRSAMEQLKIIPSTFPQVGAAAAITEPPVHPKAECGCPTRSQPPARPNALPFEATTENTEKMREWLLDRYAASTFNICPHQPLPAMTGPPMTIRVSPDATPVASTRPVRVPIHWREAVNDQLERDVALEVIEKVPPNTPVTWMHNMVLTAKPDGTPRRTVDLQTLNKVSVRETHHTVPPAKQARAVPKGQLKTVTDAWNGYHSIEICPEDRDKTTFITENGRYRYCRAPMGFLASGDAYTHRYDLIVADVPRLTKCVDDALLYDDIEDRGGHWWRVIDYLIKVGENGVILNPGRKFQFAKEEVDYTAFRISLSDVKPLPKYLQAIEEFPRPKNITDIRAWFGLVNQVSHYGQIKEMMAPFKALLSPKTIFRWTDELEAAFQNSKAAIIAAIEQGVEIFDPARRTCLQTDYSCTGLGYWLRQKYCECPSMTPDCCQDGWRITLAGSRFLREAERRYAPIEGECLAVAWALEDTRWFTMGCDELVIVTDHKPLTKILGDRSLDAMTNPRLFRLKQRTMMWRYSIFHVAGKANPAADATSRNPAVTEEEALSVIRLHGITDGMEAEVVAGTRSGAKKTRVVTWASLQQATKADHDLQILQAAVTSGFPDARANLSASIQEYWQYRDDLSIVDGVIMLGQRMIIPTELRTTVLQALHGAHQGVSGMKSRAQDSVFWPGISLAIDQVRGQCAICCQMAPSQPHLPPTTPTAPTYPFQRIAADYFALGGIKYLVIVDRFTGWPHICRAQKSHEATGASGLVRALKVIFATFGAPEEVSSDGGPEFSAAETQDFLSRWGVHHRLSSAYNPRSNGRAEVAVKSMKRLLKDNTGIGGSLDDDRVVAGLLQYRNTPDPDTGMSPSQILFGRALRDRIPIPARSAVFQNPHISPIWRETWAAREDALRERFGKQTNSIRRGTRALAPLSGGEKVIIQNSHGPHPNKWDRTGVVVEQLPFDQFLVRVDGSGRITRRNRRQLRKFVPFRPTTSQQLLTPAGHLQTVSPPAVTEPLIAQHEHSSSQITRPSEPVDLVQPTGHKLTEGEPAPEPELDVVKTEPPAHTCEHNAPGDTPADQVEKTNTPEPVGLQAQPPPPSGPRRSQRDKYPPFWSADYSR